VGDQGAAARVVITRSQPAPASVGAVMVRPAVCALRRGRWLALGSQEPATGARALPAPPAVPVPCRLAPWPEPAEDRERLLRVRCQGAGRWVEAQHPLRLLADRERPTPAISIPPVRHHAVPSLPLGAPQMFTPAPVGALDLPQTACSAVVGQMQPPGSPRPPRRAETAGSDAQDTPPSADAQRVGDLGRGAPLAQEPAPPWATRAEALTPGSFGKLGAPPSTAQAPSRRVERGPKP
jgi:hypothetical protein